jgi:NADH:ubiquinone oxidoreductase subunit
MADEISLRGEAQFSQFYELNRLLDRIVQLKEELLDMEDNQKNKHSVVGYKPILYAYLELDFDQHVFQHPKLQRRINGIKNVKKRYEGNLYEKREIIYRVLRESANTNGRWKSVTAAINDVYPTLEKELKAFDQNWVKNRIAENNSKIAKLQEALENNKKRYKRAGDIKIQDRTYINYIKSLEEKNREFRQALKAYNVADILKKKSLLTRMIKNKHFLIMYGIVQSCLQRLLKKIPNRGLSGHLEIHYINTSICSISFQIGS